MPGEEVSKLDTYRTALCCWTGKCLERTASRPLPPLARTRPDARTIPIIAMTANIFDEDVQRSLQVGMNALSKPVDPKHLFQTLEELIWEAKQSEDGQGRRRRKTR